jgi:hypothetical protein
LVLHHVDRHEVSPRRDRQAFRRAERKVFSVGCEAGGAHRCGACCGVHLYTGQHARNLPHFRHSCCSCYGLLCGSWRPHGRAAHRLGSSPSRLWSRPRNGSPASLVAALPSPWSARHGRGGTSMQGGRCCNMKSSSARELQGSSIVGGCAGREARWSSSTVGCKRKRW